MNKKSIPNLLTYFRMAAVPVAIAFIIWLPNKPAAFLVLFLLASLSDFLDGYLARKWHAVTPIGTLLDPIADKMLVTVILIYLLKAVGLMPIVPVVLLLTRELYISGLREFLGTRGKTLPVSKGGKWKTALQMLSIILMLAAPVFPLTLMRHGYAINLLWNLGIAILWLSVILSLISAVNYTRKAWPQLRA